VSQEEDPPEPVVGEKRKRHSCGQEDEFAPETSKKMIEIADDILRDNKREKRPLRQVVFVQTVHAA